MQIEKARDNLYTASVNGQYLHSRYSPAKEAEKFYKQWKSENKTDSSCDLIVFAPGLGYLLDVALKDNYNRILVFFLSRDTYDFYIQNFPLENLSIWYPGCSHTPDNFIRKQFRDILPENLRILEWKPVLNSFPEMAGYINREFINTLKILQGNTITTMKFGKRWLKNSFRNFLEQEYSLFIERIQIPVILAVSGGSLNRHLDVIKRYEKSYFIAALPSSVEALSSADITPDLIFSIDPGYYASDHYKTFPAESTIASTLMAYPGKFSGKIAGINQHTWIDSLFNENDTLFTMSSPEMGTVAATAINILSGLCEKEVFIVGLDLCIRGLEEHAHPHPFDLYSIKGANRFFTETGRRMERIRDMSHFYRNGYYYSRSMETYKNWFNTEEFKKGIIRVDPSPVSLPFQEICTIPFRDEKCKPPAFWAVNNHYPEYSQRKKQVQRIIKNWRKELDSLRNTNTIDKNASIGVLLKNIYPRLQGDRIHSDKIEEYIDDINGVLNKICLS